MKLVQLTINDEGFIRQNLWAFNNSERKSNKHIEKIQKKKNFEVNMDTHGNKDLKYGISSH